MKMLLSLCLVLIAVSILYPAQAEVYRWVDEDGTVHFTDTPPSDKEDLEPIELPPLPTVELEPVTLPTPDDVEASPAPPDYQRFFIAQPEDNTSVRANDGDISVVLGIIPGLRAEHSVYLYLDGRLVAQGDQTAFPLSNLDRGTHQVQAEIRNGDGVLIATEPVTFTLHRHSILNP